MVNYEEKNLVILVEIWNLFLIEQVPYRENKN